MAWVVTVLLIGSESGAGRIARWHTRKCIFQQKCQEIGKEEKAVKDGTAIKKWALASLHSPKF
jgi:hypothetical protein